MKTLTILSFLMMLLTATTTGCSRSKNPDKYLERANKYYDAKELEKAKLEYLSTLKLDPTNATAILRLGKIFYRQGQLREAFPFLLESRKRSPSDLEGAGQLATIYLAGGDLVKARTEATGILAISPTNEPALTVLTDAAQTPKEVQEFLQQLDQLETKAGKQAIFHALRAQIAQRQKDTPAANAEVQKALTLDANSIIANLVLGSIRWSQGQTNQAEQAFRTAAQLGTAADSARYRLANFLLRTGRLEEAKKTLDDINHDAPERTAAWTLRAEIALSEKQYDECERLLGRALSQAPRDFEALSTRAQLKLAQNKPAEAVTQLESLVEIRPRSGELQYQLAVAQLLNKQLLPAVESLSKAAALDTNNISAVLMLAELNLARGQAASAIGTLNDLVRRRPTLARAQLLLGRAYLAAGRPEDALAVFRTMQTQFPKDPVPPFQIGLLLREKKQDAEARKAFEESQKLAPDDLGVLDQLVSLDLAAKQPQQASARLQPRLDQTPKSARLWLLRARIEAAQQNKDGAEKALEKAIELEPELQPAYLMLAELYLRTGEPKESLKRLDELLHKNSSNMTALTLKGMIHGQLEQLDEAQRTYEAALKLNPNFVLALNNLAYLLAERRNQLDEAYTYAAKAHELAAKDASIADTLGWIEYRRKNYPEALRLLLEAQEGLPGQPEVEYHLGMTHAMMGDEAAAKRSLTVALKSPTKFPGRELAEERLAVLNLKPGQTGEVAIATLEKQRQTDPKDLLTTLRLAVAYEAANDLTRAREAYEAAIKLNPSASEAVTRLAALEIDRDPNRALELARQAQKLAPNDPVVNQTLGRLALLKGDATAAYGLLQSSARQQTNQPGIYADWAVAAFGTSRLKEAGELMSQAIRLGLPTQRTNSATVFLRLLEAGQNPTDAGQNLTWIGQVLKQDPTNGPALYASALGLEQQAKYAEAREAHEKLLQRYPSFILSTRQLAILYAERLNNDAKAYELATRARTSLPKDEVLARTLGGLAFRRGDFRYAVQLYNEVARNQPKDADLQFQLGLAYVRLKQLPEGQAALERAIALNPKGSFVPEARKILAEHKAG